VQKHGRRAQQGWFWIGREGGRRDCGLPRRRAKLRRVRPSGKERKKSEGCVEEGGAPDHGARREAVVGGTLIGMAAMCGPEALAPPHAQAQRESGICHVIGGQEQCGGAMAVSGELAAALSAPKSAPASWLSVPHVFCSWRIPSRRDPVTEALAAHGGQCGL